MQVSLLEESIKPRTNLPPLLVSLRERRPEKLHYIGVSFGLTLDLFRFWRRHKFAPFYIGQIPVELDSRFYAVWSLWTISYACFLWKSKVKCFSVSYISLLFSWIKSTVTGEHTCMVLKPLNNDEIEANESAQWGFFGPFYRGEVFTFRSAISLCYMQYLILRLWSKQISG